MLSNRPGAPAPLAPPAPLALLGVLGVMALLALTACRVSSPTQARRPPHADRSLAAQARPLPLSLLPASPPASPGGTPSSGPAQATSPATTPGAGHTTSPSPLRTPQGGGPRSPSPGAPPAGQSPSPGETPPAGSAPSPAPPGRLPPSSSSLRTIGLAPDAAGDAGPMAPGYADLTMVTLADGGSFLRITVDVAAAIPSRLAGSEVEGIGVDLFRSGRSESDYQVFADGGPDGWFAYLQTPSGFVAFPGSFLLGSNRMVFDLPWQALGDLSAGSFSAFCDWSRSVAPTAALSTEDHDPDSGTSPFAR